MLSLVHIAFLSKDVVYHDLGLLIVDEEQRFGVTHKEKLKAVENKRRRPDVDGNTNSTDTSYVNAWCS